MNSFDNVIINSLNLLSQLSWTFDNTVEFISANHLFKGGALLVIFWWGWFRINKIQPRVRLHLIASLFGCFIAMFLARALAVILPFRLRPLHEEGLGLILPYGMKPMALEGESSFPSDHAVLFYALSIGMFYISKKVGIFALVYTTLIIGFPRVYLGLHYPTDIIGGAFIGIVIALLCQSNYFLKRVSQPVLDYSNTKPGIFYPLFFITTYQIADMFESSRAFFSFLSEFYLPLLA